MSNFQDYIKNTGTKNKRRIFTPDINIRKTVTKKKNIVEKKVDNSKENKLYKILENVTDSQLDKILEMLSTNKKVVVEKKEVITDKPKENPDISEEANRASWILDGLTEGKVGISDIVDKQKPINKSTGNKVSEKTNHANLLL